MKIEKGQSRLTDFTEKKKEELKIEIEEKIERTIFQRDITIDDLKIPEIIKNRWKKDFLYLYPNQVEIASSIFKIPIKKSAVKSDIDYNVVSPDKVIIKKFDNYLVTTATSSGKTMIAHMFMIDLFSKTENQSIIVYTVPLKALANEKYREFSELYKGIFDVKMIVGSEEKYSGNKSKKQIIITTNEKFDQLMRNQKEDFFDKIIGVVIDEIHLLGSKKRGKVIEECISKLLSQSKKIIGLSATIKNATEISKWLNSGLINLYFRPVPIERGFVTDSEAFIIDKHGEVKDTINISESVMKLGEIKTFIEKFLINLYLNKESALYFRQSRKHAESTAKQLMIYLKKSLKVEEDKTLELPSIKGGENGTDYLLNQCIKYGVGFHHAGLSSDNKEYIEKLFTQKKIKILACTPTLAIGVNVPARWVLVDFKAFRDGEYTEINSSEYKQIEGRSGRPQYDKIGYSLLVTKNLSYYERCYLTDLYFSGECDPIESNFKSFEDLLMSVLGMIGGNYANTNEELIEIYKNTLAYIQDEDFRENLGDLIQKSINFLRESTPQFIALQNNKYIITKFGELINQLYIHPDIAVSIYNFLCNRDKYDLSHFSIVYFMFAKTDLEPLFAKKTDTLFLSVVRKNISDKNIKLYEDELNDNALKTASILIGDNIYNGLTWANNSTKEDDFLENYDLSSGDIEKLIGFTGNFRWMHHSIWRIAKFFNFDDVLTLLHDLEVRLRYGISPNLIELCEIKYVGKFFASHLFKKGFTTIRDVANASYSDLGLGEKRGETIIANAKKLL